MRRLFVSMVVAAGAILAEPAAAQAPAVTQIKGVIQSVDGARVTITPSTGEPPVALIVGEATRVSVEKSIDVASIQPGSFIGTRNVERSDGQGISTEVHVFPPGVRAGEGHYPMPGQQAMMTNGDVTTVV